MWLSVGGSWASFVLSFRGFVVLLFCGWGVFFRGWGGFFRGWAVLGVPWFFVSLSRGWFLLLWSLPVPLGCCRGSCVRVVARFRLVRAGGAACPRVAWLVPLGSGRGGLSALRFLALRSSWLLLVGGVVGGLRLRCLSRGVGWLGRCPGAWRPAFAFFLVFFNICRARLWHPPCACGFFAALNGGI